MKKVLIQALIFLILGFIPFSVYAVEYAFTPINVPDASSTYAYGISGTNIVGYYQDSNAFAHGFVYNGKTYDTLDVLNAIHTEAYGISGKNIVGAYMDSSRYWHGFLYNGRTCTTLDVPNALDTYAYGISGKNIVGYYVDSWNHSNGFLYNGKTYTTFDVPDAWQSAAFGISGRNIVGEYYGDYDGTWNGFLATPTSDTSTPPTVVEFSVSSPSTSLTVSISTFTAIDSVAVTGYMVTTSPMAPSAKSTKWSASPPTSFTFPSTTKSGTKTLYAWAKDADGNVSKSLSAQVMLNL